MPRTTIISSFVTSGFNLLCWFASMLVCMVIISTYPSLNILRNALIGALVVSFTFSGKTSKSAKMSHNSQIHLFSDFLHCFIFFLSFFLNIFVSFINGSVNTFHR